MTGPSVDRTTYPPLGRLKPVADSIWIVDGPAIGFGVAGLKLPFPTRMTVIRLADGSLFVHSPTELTQDLRQAVEEHGPVMHLVAPNRIHHWWIPDWHAAFPAASVWLAPKVREEARGRIDFPARPLSGRSGYPWDGAIETLPVASGYMTEFVFFHRASRTLVLTDLIENFEPEKTGWLTRIMARIGGVLDPHGSMPRDMRLTFRGRREGLKAAVSTMIEWAPERVILAHGRWYETDGTGELKRAFSWLF